MGNVLQEQNLFFHKLLEKKICVCKISLSLSLNSKPTRPYTLVPTKKKEKRPKKNRYYSKTTKVWGIILYKKNKYSSRAFPICHKTYIGPFNKTSV